MSKFYRPEYHDAKHCKTNLRSKTKYYILRSLDFALPLRSFKVRLLKVSCACPMSPELSPPVRNLQLDLSQQMASLSTKCSEEWGVNEGDGKDTFHLFGLLYRETSR